MLFDGLYKRLRYNKVQLRLKRFGANVPYILHKFVVYAKILTSLKDYGLNTSFKWDTMYTVKRVVSFRLHLNQRFFGKIQEQYTYSDTNHPIKLLAVTNFLPFIERYNIKKLS